jgi:hypothetical protein
MGAGVVDENVWVELMDTDDGTAMRPQYHMIQSRPWLPGCTVIALTPASTSHLHVTCKRPDALGVTLPMILERCLLVPVVTPAEISAVPLVTIVPDAMPLVDTTPDITPSGSSPWTVPVPAVNVGNVSPNPGPFVSELLLAEIQNSNL